MVMMMMVMVMVMIMHFNDREATSDRITLGVTAVLTLSAISLDSRSDLPKVIILNHSRAIRSILIPTHPFAFSSPNFHSHHPIPPVAFSLFWHSLKTENQSEVINHSQPAALSFPSPFLCILIPYHHSHSHSRFIMQLPLIGSSSAPSSTAWPPSSNSLASTISPRCK